MTNKLKEPLDYQQKPLRGHRDRRFLIWFTVTFVGIAFAYAYLTLEDHPVFGDSILAVVCLVLGMFLSVTGIFGVILRLGVLQDQYRRQQKEGRE